MNAYQQRRAAFFDEVRSRYEAKLGQRLDLESRRQEEVIHRMALSTACRPFLTTVLIGKMLGKDHTSIVHYHKEHEPMLLHSGYYREQFLDAMSIVESVSDEMDIHPARLGKKGPNLDGQLKALQQLLFKLEELYDRMVDNKKNQSSVWKKHLQSIHLPSEGDEIQSA